MLHAARDLVVEGMPVAEAARRKGVARATLQRFIRARAGNGVNPAGHAAVRLAMLRT